MVRNPKPAKVTFGFAALAWTEGEVAHEIDISSIIDNIIMIIIGRDKQYLTSGNMTMYMEM